MRTAMNESLTDPVLRSFRQPLVVRLREKVDELRGTIDAQAATIARMGRREKQLERELRIAKEELAMVTRAITSGKGGGNTADVSSAVTRTRTVDN